MASKAQLVEGALGWAEISAASAACKSWWSAWAVHSSVALAACAYTVYTIHYNTIQYPWSATVLPKYTRSDSRGKALDSNMGRKAAWWPLWTVIERCLNKVDSPLWRLWYLLTAEKRCEYKDRAQPAVPPATLATPRIKRIRSPDDMKTENISYASYENRSGEIGLYAWAVKWLVPLFTLLEHFRSMITHSWYFQPLQFYDNSSAAKTLHMT